MCGIAVYLGGAEGTARTFVRRANLQQAHRGPDGEGEFYEPGVGLGHRRLAILDLTCSGSQPMKSDDGRWVLVYNGEVYNHLELRRELGSKWRFRGRSDAETVLAALATWGHACLEKMVGMWALALWDRQTQTLLVARDRYGQKPLYWRRTNGGLKFASEIKALLEPEELPTADRGVVAEFLASGNYGHLGERTFYSDLKAFPPAHWAHVTSPEPALNPVRYWRFPAAEQVSRPFDASAGERLRQAIEHAVASQLMADVPVGATLSGGIDSSIVVGLIARRGGSLPLKVFTAQAPGTAGDESRYVAAVKAKWGDALEIHTTPLAGNEIGAAVERTVRQQEEPFGDPSIVAHGLLMDAAKQAGIRVILGGQGADELFFGYRFMQHSLMVEALRTGRWRWLARELAWNRPSGEEAVRMAFASLWPLAERRLRAVRRRTRTRWLSAKLQDAVDAQSGVATLIDSREVWIRTVEEVALPHLVHYDDRSAMARGLEGRMPFLDHRLADVVARLQPTAFLRAGKSKWPLRSACAEVLPVEVSGRRDKVGFFTPLTAFLVSSRHRVQEVLLDPSFLSLGWVDETAVKSLLGRGTRSQVDETALRTWRLFCAAVWAREFRVSC